MFFPLGPPGKLLLIHQDPAQISPLFLHLPNLFPPYPLLVFLTPFLPSTDIY